MTVDFDDRRIDTADGGLLRQIALGVIDATLEYDGISRSVNVGLSLVDEPDMREINYKFRGVDSATDVLSFPMIDYDLKKTSGMAGDIDPETGELILGDIVVSVQRAREQAAEYGHSFQREFGYLVAHGMLHLLGYDHEMPTDAAVMREIEEKVLHSLSLSRD